MNFGEKLRIAREKAGISQADLARALGVGQPFVHRIERGIKPLPHDRLPLIPQPMYSAIIQALIDDLNEQIAVLRASRKEAAE